MSEVKTNKEWLEWLEWFYCEADFGPADSDVRNMLMDAYEADTGNTCPAREDEEEWT